MLYVIGKYICVWLKMCSFWYASSEYDYEVPNDLMPGQLYSIAKYACENGYESESLRLYCSEGEWVGKYPECLQVTISEDDDDFDVGVDSNSDSDDDGAVVKETESSTSKTESSVSMSCSSANSCQHVCVMTENGTTEQCQCHEGFFLDPQTQTACIDIDECQSGDNGGCNHICINRPGTVLCQCESGYTLSEDGKTCVDDNECLLNNGHGPCQDSCSNNQGH